MVPDRPYKAYYYTNRFADVINLADTTLNDTIAEPVLEESLYWRGMAYYMAGKTDLAVNDYRAALESPSPVDPCHTSHAGSGSTTVMSGLQRFQTLEFSVKAEVSATSDSWDQ